MPTLNLTLPLSYLRAARTHAAETDVRFYLCGVYLDTKAGKLIATDGHRLFCAGVPGVHVPNMPRSVDFIANGVIIPNAAIDQALKLYTGEYARGKRMGDVGVPVTVTWTISPDPEREGVTVLGVPVGSIGVPNGGSITFSPIDARFPNWRQVMPQPDAIGEALPAVCNYQYIADACDAIVTARNMTKKAAASHPVRIMYRGEHPAIVTDGDSDVVAIVMPMRNDIHVEAPIVACRAAHADSVANTDAAA